MVEQKHYGMVAAAMVALIFLMRSEIIDESLARILEVALVLYIAVIFSLAIKEDTEKAREKQARKYRPRPGSEKRFMIYLVGTMISFFMMVWGIGVLLGTNNTPGLWGIGLFIIVAAVFLHTLPKVAPFSRVSYKRPSEPYPADGEDPPGDRRRL